MISLDRRGINLRSFKPSVVVGAFSLILLAGLPALVSGASKGGEPWIAVFWSDLEPVLRSSAIPIWDREDGVVVAGLTGAQLDEIRARGAEPAFSVRDHGEGIYVLSHDRQIIPPSLLGLSRFRIDDRAMLYLIPAGLEMELPRLKLRALFHGVPRVALPPIQRHAADALALAARPPRPASNPLVRKIVDATRQEIWFQDVRDLSGDADVTIPGYCTDCRIRTRASNYMFPLNNAGDPPGNPFATEYLEDKAAGWGFTGPNAVRESYTATDSGCTAAQGSQAWQNVIFTLPGQIDYAQNQQIISSSTTTPSRRTTRPTPTMRRERTTRSRAAPRCSRRCGPSRTTPGNTR
jgi:hypothetical protein